MHVPLDWGEFLNNEWIKLGGWNAKWGAKIQYVSYIFDLEHVNETIKTEILALKNRLWIERETLHVI